MKESAIVLTSGLFKSHNAKTAFGLIRNSEQYDILAVIDQNSAGEDAGKLVDGKVLEIPIHSTLKDFLRSCSSRLNLTPEECGRGVYAIIGIATPGGIIPAGLRMELLEALSYGMHIINGLHHYLNDDHELVQIAENNQAKLLDIRKPKSAKDHAFWTGNILDVRAPRIAMFGTDCALGKRTSSLWLRDACREHGIRTEMIYTGQTGKLQGGRFGFILDSTLNDFVSGELEDAIIRCDLEENPDLMLLEGQSSLRNPSGPCGSEYLCSAQAKGVILQFAPKQKYYLADDERKLWPMPPLEEELELIRLYGSQTLAIALNSFDLTKKELEAEQKNLEDRLGLPVVCPKEEGMGRLVPVVQEFIASQAAKK
ncbi:MAG: DUF1611 domain-containing protein [SAR324 cluster bacterium]|nr:DUF1611 domain-containing protein [SAR324 cluster bacterium]MBL7035758.1 DUF1611 domain-containing protein [SAR324 cluster bacterium]